MLTLSRGSTVVEVDPAGGGRLRQLTVDGRALLMAAAPDDPPIFGGCYPMVPWAGRVRDGRFTFAGRGVQLELDAPPHALHGLAYRRPWHVVDHDDDHAVLGIDLGTPAMVSAGWPFGGSVVQTIRAVEDGVEMVMQVTAGPTDPLPLVFGWHPWFARHLEGVAGQLRFDAAAMLRRGPDGLPTGERVPVPDGPWDDCMVGVAGAPSVLWEGVGEVRVANDLDHLIVFDGHAGGLCLEPQSGPPNAFEDDPFVLAPGAVTTGRMALRWRPAG